MSEFDASPLVGEAGHSPDEGFIKELNMEILIGSDHGGYKLKQEIIKYLNELGHAVEDCGSYSEESCDYPDIAQDVAKKVLLTGKRAILVCGTGIGVSIAANKVKGAYAACIHDVYQAQRAELSNHANIITMGSQVIGTKLAECMVEEYLSCTFDPNGRSGDKVQRIVDFENEQ